jgi:putative spermidine/putrescine transport system permease protein
MSFPLHAGPFEKAVHIGTRVAAGLALVFLMAPLLVIVPLSFNAESVLIFPIREWSLRWYELVLSSAEWREAAANTLFVAVCTASLSTVLGTLAALGLHRHDFRLRTLVVAILLSPMIVPLIVTAISIYFFFALFGLIGTYRGLILAHMLVSTPFVVITVLSTLANYDTNLSRAAAGMGAGPLRIFFSVTLPLILPGVVTGALFAFVTSLDEIVLTLFIAGPNQQTLPRAMWKTVRENITPEILAVACIITLMSAFVLAAVEILRRRSLRQRGLQHARRT